MERDFERAGVPVAARLRAPAIAEGGDTLWLDDRTLLVGHGYSLASPPPAKPARTLGG